MEMNLVGKDGTSIQDSRVKVINGRAYGQIDLQSNTDPGNYLLVLDYPGEPVENYLYSRLVPIYSSNVNDHSDDNEQIVASRGSQDNSSVKLSLTKSQFDKREKVSLSIRNTDLNSNDLELSVVVRKRRLSNGKALSENENNRAKNDQQFQNPDSHKSLLYELEKVEGPDETAVSSAFIVEEQKEMMLFRNDDGKYVLDASNIEGGTKTFFFNHFYFLPWSDNSYRYVRKRWMNGGELVFDWAQKSRNFSSILPIGMDTKLKMSPAIKGYISQKGMRDQIASAYGSASVLELNNDSNGNYIPTEWFDVKDYSIMTSLPEYLREIVSGLKYTDKDGVKDFRFSYPGDKYRGYHFS